MLLRILQQAGSRALRVRMVRRAQPLQTHEGEVSGGTARRARAAFEARQDAQGRLLIGLTLTPEGQSAAKPSAFSFELAPSVGPEDVNVLVGALNRCVTHLSLPEPLDEGAEGEGS